MQIIGLDCDIINDFPEGNTTFLIRITLPGASPMPGTRDIIISTGNATFRAIQIAGIGI